MVNTVSELFDMLGGTTAVAIILNTHGSSVSRAKTEGRIPAPWRLPLYLAAEARGIKADLKVFE